MESPRTTTGRFWRRKAEPAPSAKASEPTTSMLITAIWRSEKERVLAELSEDFCASSATAAYYVQYATLSNCFKRLSTTLPIGPLDES